VRGVFDQYSVQENQLTHALLTALARDPDLAKAFLAWIGLGVPVRKPKFLQQSLPGELAEVSEGEADRRGLPDGVIFEPDRYTVLIEAKAAATPTPRQLKAHLSTAQRKGFAAPLVVLITIKPITPAFEADWLRVREWTEVYAWLKARPRGFWGTQVTAFLEAKESRWVADNYLREGTLTTFSGIPFDRDEERYDYFQAKRLIKLLRRELVDHPDMRALNADTASTGRTAITGRMEDRVWDFIPIVGDTKDDAFTQNVHLTLALLQDCLQAYVTIPNGIRSRRRSRLLGGSLEAFSSVIGKATTNLTRLLRTEPGGRPGIVVVQRYYKTQRAVAEQHAQLRFDPRTFFKTGGSQVKHQPQWLEATYAALRHRNSNLQLQIGMDFPYSTCERVRGPEAVDLVANVWTACKPVLDAIADTNDA
jgi:hypothetical protein